MTNSAAAELPYLERAVALARRNLETGDGGPFGAVIVFNQQIIGEGSNQVLRSHDPTAHAEVVAIRAASQALSRFHLNGATLYSSCEPCPMCLAAAHWAQIGHIVFAADRHDAAAAGFQDDDLYQLFERPGIASGMRRERRVLSEAQAVMRAWADLPGRKPY
ncbi:MAG: nucleoside deaminase [Pseudomonadota bacterium]|nr:nucleoside deaminase [Pseudomonadota bacterium]